MSFYDELDESVLEFLSDSDDSIQNEDGYYSYEIGDVVYYDPLDFSFMVASKDKLIAPQYLKDWETIMIGIIIKVNDDNTVNVLMAGFLMADCLRLPMMYLNKTKKKFIRNYVKDMFRRYVSAFFKQCPGYQDLLKLDISMPDTDELKTIHANRETLFDNIRLCSDQKSLTKYIHRLYNNYIYAVHNNLIYQMKIDTESDVDIQLPDVRPAEFLCVFKNIDLNTKISDELQSEVVENDILFDDGQ